MTWQSRLDHQEICGVGSRRASCYRRRRHQDFSADARDVL